MNENPETQNRMPVADLAVDALLASFLEHEKWLETEIAEMDKDRSRYVEADHYGLPYARLVLKMIRKQASETHPASHDPHAAAIFDLHRKRQGLG